MSKELQEKIERVEKDNKELRDKIEQQKLALAQYQHALDHRTAELANTVPHLVQLINWQNNIINQDS